MAHGGVLVRNSKEVFLPRGGGREARVSFTTSCVQEESREDGRTTFGRRFFLHTRARETKLSFTTSSVPKESREDGRRLVQHGWVWTGFCNRTGLGQAKAQASLNWRRRLQDSCYEWSESVSHEVSSSHAEKEPSYVAF
jgi:hypothetical protein